MLTKWLRWFWRHRGRVTRFFVSGLTAAAVTITLLYLLVDVAGWWYLVATMLAFLGGLAISFTLQKLWAFRDYQVARAILRKQLGQFFLVAAANFMINVGLMYFFVDLVGFGHLLAQIFTGAFIAVNSFLFYQLIFDPKPVE